MQTTVSLVLLTTNRPWASYDDCTPIKLHHTKVVPSIATSAAQGWLRRLCRDDVTLMLQGCGPFGGESLQGICFRRPYTLLVLLPHP